MINGLLDITLAVPEPDELVEFWRRRGLSGSADLGSAERPGFLRITDGPYRHLAGLHLGCESEADLHDIGWRLEDLGVAAAVADTTLRVEDPVFDHTVTVDVVGPRPLTAGPTRAANGPGHALRRSARADVVLESRPRPPRRVGHVVLATPQYVEANAFYVDGLGFRVSDKMLDGVLTFMRCESDHHNLLIQPGSVSYLNHYAVEMDDLDAIGAAGTAVVAERSEADVVGIGRHLLGSNLFWYLTDPAGNMFEFFADMDQIDDDALWDREIRRDDWTPDEAGLSIWGAPEAPEVFFEPPDIATIGAAREARGKR